MKLYPYKTGSISAKQLAEALGIKRVKMEGKPLRMKGVLINWGASKLTREFPGAKVFNLPVAVKIASNKLNTFDMLHGVCTIPEYTVDKAVAQQWVDAKKTVVERHTLTGHSGAGIRIVGHDVGEIGVNNAPLYVKYIPKTSEFRLHATQAEVFFVQRKARNKDIPNDKVNWRVRNHGNGFIYAHQDVDVPEAVKQQAIMAVKTLGLDFGAVDIIHNVNNGTYYVLEVNTAPGLSGETLKQYVNMFNKMNLVG